MIVDLDGMAGIDFGVAFHTQICSLPAQHGGGSASFGYYRCVIEQKAPPGVGKVGAMALAHLGCFFRLAAAPVKKDWFRLLRLVLRTPKVRWPIISPQPGSQILWLLRYNGAFSAPAARLRASEGTAMTTPR
ncbi:hypothetical protein [Hymenobacter sp. IS2118]|uniref:hypothetical protein n=1 Tax=Hymenobacter sp. IS2118 TaxID=1505605 RepID=UPI001267CBFA|nr:hypothetical protein [Hymenobacter sp. IS2118]